MQVLSLAFGDPTGVLGSPGRRPMLMHNDLSVCRRRRSFLSSNAFLSIAFSDTRRQKVSQKGSRAPREPRNQKMDPACPERRATEAGSPPAKPLQRQART